MQDNKFRESLSFKLKEAPEGSLVCIKFINQVKSTIACIGLHLKLKIMKNINEKHIKHKKKAKKNCFFTSLVTAHMAGRLRCGQRASIFGLVESGFNCQQFATAAALSSVLALGASRKDEFR